MSCMDSSLCVAVMAAGASRRLGRPKQLIRLDDQSLVRRQVRIAITAGVGPVAAVIGCEAASVQSEIVDLPAECLQNDEWPEGLASSIRSAARWAKSLSADGLLIYHVDQFRLESADLAALVEAWRIAPARPIRSKSGTYAGPPVILPSALFAAAAGLQGDQGARSVLAVAGEVPTEFEMPAADSDLDMPDDLEQVAIRICGRK